MQFNFRYWVIDDEDRSLTCLRDGYIFFRVMSWEFDNPERLDRAVQRMEGSSWADDADYHAFLDALDFIRHNRLFDEGGAMVNELTK